MLRTLIHRYARPYIVWPFPSLFIASSIRQRPEDKLPALIGPDELHLQQDMGTTVQQSLFFVKNVPLLCGRVHKQTAAGISLEHFTSLIPVVANYEKSFLSFERWQNVICSW